MAPPATVMVIHHQVDAAGQQVRQRLRALAIGHVGQADPGHLRQQLAREVLGGADADGAEGDLARAGPRCRDQVGHAADGPVRAGGHYEGEDRDGGDEGEVRF